MQYCTVVDSFGALDFTRYQDALLGHIRSIVRDSCDAEDVLQNVFVRAHQRVEQLRVDAAMSTWLFRLATHASVDHLRNRARQPQFVHEINPDDVDDTRQPPRLLQTLLEQREMSECIQRYILDLPSDYRTVIMLHDLEGLTAAEIATTLGLSLANVKVRLLRARARLKAALKTGCSLDCDCRGVLVCEPKTE